MLTDPRSTFRSALWNHAGKILEYMLMYLTSVLVARGLGVQENGVFVGLFSVSQLLLVLLSFGLEVTLNKHVPQLEGDRRIEQLRFLLRRALQIRVMAVALLAAVLSGMLAGSLIPRNLASFVWILLGYTCIRSIVSLVAIVLIAELQTRSTSLINVLTRALEALIIGLMVPGGMTTTSVFVVILSTATFQLACFMVAARTQLFGKAERVVVLPIFLFGGIYWINTAVEFFLGRQGDVLFLSMLLPDPTQASLYDVAFAVSQLASLSMTLGLGGITLATSAKLALSSSDLLERFYAFMIRLTSLLSIPLYAYILFNAGSVLFVLYSTRYAAAAGLIQGIACFRIVSRLFGGPENAEFLLSRGYVSKLVGIGVVGAVINVGLDLLCIPGFGAPGAVVGSGIGNLAVNLLGVLAVRRSSSARIQWQYWVKIVSASCVSSFVAGFLLPPTGIFMIGMQVLCYAVLLTAFLIAIKPLTSGDREWLSRADSRFAGPVGYLARQDTPLLETPPP